MLYLTIYFTTQNIDYVTKLYQVFYDQLRILTDYLLSKSVDHEKSFDSYTPLKKTIPVSLSFSAISHQVLLKIPKDNEAEKGTQEVLTERF